MIPNDKRPFCPICDKFLYNPDAEYPQICGKHLIDDDLKRFLEKIVAAITTLLLELEALGGEEELKFIDDDED